VLRRPRLPPAPAPLHVSPSNSPTASPPSCWPPQHATTLCRPPELPLSTAADHRRLPPLQPCQRHLLLLAAPTCCLQASRGSSSSPLAFFRALHVAPPLPELRRPPRPSSAASSSYCSPCPLLILKHVPRRSSTFSIPSRARCRLLLPLLD
jgi:hypothetical protein